MALPAISPQTRPVLIRRSYGPREYIIAEYQIGVKEFDPYLVRAVHHNLRMCRAAVKIARAQQYFEMW